MIAKIHSAIPYGFEGKIIEVEGDANRGLPAFNIVGMANKTISEAKERVRSAISNSMLTFPSNKLTISLAPAELQKDGAYLDLPIALSVLVLSNQLKMQDVGERLFVGELSLDGKVRPVRGIINVIEVARAQGYDEIYVPIDNLEQAALVSGVKIYGVKTLKDLFLALKRQQELPLASDTTYKTLKFKNVREEPINANARIFREKGDVVKNTKADEERGDKSGKMKNGAGNHGEAMSSDAVLDHIRGQKLAKRAMAIAIAGHHNILISGPPGAGKTLLAKAAANLLPEPTAEEKIEITKIYSLAGLATDCVIEKRPFRSPHHSASTSSLLGGGPLADPGEISLAHRGVLFLDELPEFSRSALEALRQPLEDKVITVSRTRRKTSYPADFMLIATMNPCPCGYLGDETHECKCTTTQILNYQRRLSGPLFDRIDIHVNVERVKNAELIEVGGVEANEHNVVKNNISEAIKRQAERFGAEGVFNSSLSSFRVSKEMELESKAKKMLAEAAEQLDLSARAYFKTIKVARTIADLEGTAEIKAEHVSEALMYRRR